VTSFGGTVVAVNDENAPEFHDRFSIHPDSVEACREALMDWAGRTSFPGAEEEIESLSDWEVVHHVETITRQRRELTKALQRATRATKRAAGSFSELHEALMPLAAENAACELEAFLAVDHS
jgi:hypothetical protein